MAPAHLLHGVENGAAISSHAARQRFERSGLRRLLNKRDAHHHDDVCGQEQHNTRVNTDGKEQRATDGCHHHTDPHEHPRTMTVEQATGHQRAHRVDDAAGQHEQTGERRAHAQSALQFLRHQIHERQSAGKRAADHDGRRTERRNAKRAQVKQWVGDVALTGRRRWQERLRQSPTNRLPPRRNPCR